MSTTEKYCRLPRICNNYLVLIFQNILADHLIASNILDYHNLQ